MCEVPSMKVREDYSEPYYVPEILAFVINDIDRIHDGEHPNQIPIAYALKGYSLSTEK